MIRTGFRTALKTGAPGSWLRSPGGVLTRVELIGWRGWLREARKDVRFALAVLVIAGFAIMGVQQAVDVVGRAPWAGAILAAFTGSSLFRSFYIMPGSPHYQRLLTGVLQPWTAFGLLLKRWSLGRASVLTLISVTIVSGIVATARAADALPFFAFAIAGSTLRALLIGRFTPSLTPSLRLPKIHMSWPRRLPTAMRISLSGTFRRKVGALPVWLLSGGLWILGTPASAMAVHNSGDPHVGFVAITLIGLICGLVFASPNIPLLRFLAFQPIPPKRLIISTCAPQFGLTVLAATAAAFCIGQPFGLAATSVAIVVGGIGFWLALLIPYALTQSVRGAPAYALRDITIAGVIKFSPLHFGFLAVGWLIFRIYVNFKTIARKRWREPL